MQGSVNARDAHAVVVGGGTMGADVAVVLARGGARVDLQLGERAKFFPTDAALASWMAQAEAGQAAIVYE